MEGQSSCPSFLFFKMKKKPAFKRSLQCSARAAAADAVAFDSCCSSIGRETAATTTTFSVPKFIFCNLVAISLLTFADALQLDHHHASHHHASAAVADSPAFGALLAVPSSPSDAAANVKETPTAASLSSLVTEEREQRAEPAAVVAPVHHDGSRTRHIVEAASILDGYITADSGPPNHQSVADVQKPAAATATTAAAPFELLHFHEVEHTPVQVTEGKSPAYWEAQTAQSSRTVGRASVVGAAESAPHTSSHTTASVGHPHRGASEAVLLSRAAPPPLPATRMAVVSASMPRGQAPSAALLHSASKRIEAPAAVSRKASAFTAAESKSPPTDSNMADDAQAEKYRARRRQQKSIRRHNHFSEDSNNSDNNNNKQVRNVGVAAFTGFGGASTSTASSSEEKHPENAAFAAFSAFDNFEDEEESMSSSLGKKVRNAVTSPASKILLGLGGVVALGTLGFRFTKDLLKQRRRQRLLRPPTPFTEMLGHVLLRSRPAAAGADLLRERLRGSSSTITEEATADVLGEPGSVTALYFTSSAVEDMLQQRGYLPFTARLEAIAAGCRRRNQKLDVVYVSADADAKEAEKHFQQMSWYAIPYDDLAGQERVQRLYRRFRISTLPHVVLLDERAQVLNAHAYAAMLMNPSDFPWRFKSLKEQLLAGDCLLLRATPNAAAKSGSSTTTATSGNTSSSSSGSGGAGSSGGLEEPNFVAVNADKNVLDNKIVGLYFSASWCPPCQAFTPRLVETVRQLKESGKAVEVVYISNDKDKKQFDEYFQKMDSFLAVPYTDTNRRAMLQETLNVRSLPTLVWLDTDGSILTRSGVAAVAADEKAKKFPWREGDIHDVSESVEGIAQDAALVLFMEYADTQHQQQQQKALEEAASALRPQKGDGGFPPLPLLFTAKKISPRSIALRRICKQEDTTLSADADIRARQQVPVMVIVDLIDQSYYVYKRPSPALEVEEDPGLITADEITAFVRDFRNERLQRHTLVVPD